MPKDKTCKICNSNEINNYSIDIGPTIVYLCNNCSVVFADPDYTKKGGDYHHQDGGEVWEKYYEPLRRKEFKNFTSKYSVLFEKATRFLDIGCGYGWFLDVVKEDYPNIDTVGVEPSYLADKLNTKKHKFYKYEAEDINKLEGRFDFISFWHVFEHLGSPHKVLKKVKRKLKKDCVLVITVPNRDGIMYRLSYLIERISFGKIKEPIKALFWVENDCGHLFDYNEQSLKILLKKHGFKVIDVWTTGSIDIKTINKRLKISKDSYGRFSNILMVYGSVILTLIGKMLRMNDVITITARKIE